MNLYKKLSLILVVVMTASFSLFLTGCPTVIHDGEEEDTYISYLKQNPIKYSMIEMENFKKNAPQRYSYNSVEISGLKDDAIVQKINKKIKDEFDSMMGAPLPAYRGILQTIDESSPMLTETIAADVKGNFNNILSILIRRTVDQNGIFYVDSKTLNFDLNTGELITLKDLFTGEDGIERLNQEAGKRIDYFDHIYSGGRIHDLSIDYLMLSMFKGVNDNQKFFLSEGKLYLVFDYDNEEFYHPSYIPYVVGIGFNSLAESLDLNKYVLSDSEIYGDIVIKGENGQEDIRLDSGEAKYLLVYGDEKQVSDDVSVPEGTDNVSLSAFCSYPEGMPDSGKEKAAEWKVFDDTFAQQLKSEGTSNPDYEYGLSNIVKGSRVGNYYNLIRNVSYFKANYWGSTINSIVYDVEGNVVELADLFKPETKYEAIIKSCIKNHYEDNFPDGDYGGNSMDELFSSLNFYLDSYGIQIVTKPIKFSMTGETDYETSVVLFIPYEEFGCENMTIFN